MNGVTIFVLCVIFLATVVRSTFGFGEALVAVPLLSLCVPVAVSVPLAVMVSIAVAAIVLVQDWKKIHFRSAAWLILATLPGLPIGLWLLKHTNANHIKVALGAIIFLFSVFSLWGGRAMELKRESQVGLIFAGFFAGILGGAFGLNGPPLVVYATLRRWSAQHMRATLQAYFFPASLITMIGMYAWGAVPHIVWRYFLYSLGPAFAAVFIGRYLNHRLHPQRFTIYVYFGLAGIGLLLLWQGLFAQWG